MEITSLTNAKVKQWVKLQQKKYRDETSTFLIENRHLVEIALEMQIVECLILRNDLESDLIFPDTYYVSEAIMKKISTNISVPKMAAVCHYFELEPVKQDRVIVLDGLQDPGNIGTIIRTALSFGYDELILSSNSVDRYNDKLVRATQGAMFTLPIKQRELKSYLQELKAEGCNIYATALQDARQLQKIVPAEKHALIFGSEGQGISVEVLKMADECIRIEMSGFESLNVAVAAGIAMYCFSMEKNSE